MAGLSGWFREEREKLRGLSPRSAAEYIWDYYKLWIIGIVSFVSLAVFLTYRIATNIPDTWVVILFVNTRAELGNQSELWQGYVEKTGYDLTEKRVEFQDQSYFDYTVNQARGNTYYELFTALVDAGQLDAVTMPPEALTALGQSGRLKDLDREECRVLRERWGDRLLYSLPYDTSYSQEPVPVGIDVSDSLLLSRYHAYPAEDGCALGIGANSEHLDAVEEFLEYIFQEVE